MAHSALHTPKNVKGSMSRRVCTIHLVETLMHPLETEMYLAKMAVAVFEYTRWRP